MEIALARLASQGVAQPQFDQSAAVVHWLGAMQAQDYGGTLWAIGLRLPHATERTIEAAITAREVVRTWPMRGTLHFVAPQDVRWLLQLLTPRIIAQSATRYRQLALDETTFARSKEIFVRALQGGLQLTRAEMYEALETAGVSAAGQRGYHILGRSAQDGLLCFGAPRGKEQTFTLLDEWVPQSRTFARDEALAELTQRYFTSHGPATVADFAWWSGLTLTDARTGVALASAHLANATLDGQAYWLSPTAAYHQTEEPSVHLLPGFDEFMLGYTDRSASLAASHAQKIQPGGNGVFSPTLVINGKVVGTWKRTVKKKAVSIDLTPFRPLTPAEWAGFAVAAQRYGEFLELPVIHPRAETTPL